MSVSNKFQDTYVYGNFKNKNLITLSGIITTVANSYFDGTVNICGVLSANTVNLSGVNINTLYQPILNSSSNLFINTISGTTANFSNVYINGSAVLTGGISGVYQPLITTATNLSINTISGSSANFTTLSINGNSVLTTSGASGVYQPIINSSSNISVNNISGGTSFFTNSSSNIINANTILLSGVNLVNTYLTAQYQPKLSVASSIIVNTISGTTANFGSLFIGGTSVLTTSGASGTYQPIITSASNISVNSISGSSAFFTNLSSNIINGGTGFFTNLSSNIINANTINLSGVNLVNTYLPAQYNPLITSVTDLTYDSAITNTLINKGTLTGNAFTSPNSLTLISDAGTTSGVALNIATITVKPGMFNGILTAAFSTYVSLAVGTIVQTSAAILPSTTFNTLTAYVLKNGVNMGTQNFTPPNNTNASLATIATYNGASGYTYNGNYPISTIPIVIDNAIIKSNTVYTVYITATYTNTAGISSGTTRYDLRNNISYHFNYTSVSSGTIINSSVSTSTYSGPQINTSGAVIDDLLCNTMTNYNPRYYMNATSNASYNYITYVAGNNLGQFVSGYGWYCYDLNYGGIASNWNTTTGVFTFSVAGYYQMNFSIYCNTVASIDCYLYKNGTAINQIMTAKVGISTNSILLYFDVNDTFYIPCGAGNYYMKGQLYTNMTFYKVG